MFKLFNPNIFSMKHILTLCLYCTYSARQRYSRNGNSKWNANTPPPKSTIIVTCFLLAQVTNDISDRNGLIGKQFHFSPSFPYV